MIDPGYGEVLVFKWQESGTMGSPYLKCIMEEAGATYTFPDWFRLWN
jgi:hypothetical protein